MNKIKVDLSGIKDKTDTYCEVEVRISDNEVVRFPRVIMDKDTYYNVDYNNEYADYMGNYILCKRGGYMYVDGKFGFMPLAVDGVLYTINREVRV